MKKFPNYRKKNEEKINKSCLKMDFEEKARSRRKKVFKAIYDLIVSIPSDVIDIIVQYEDKKNECQITCCKNIVFETNKLCWQHSQGSTFKCDSCHELFIQRKSTIICVRGSVFNRCLRCQKSLKGIDEKVYSDVADLFPTIVKKINEEGTIRAYNFFYTCPAFRRAIVVLSYPKMKNRLFDKMYDSLADYQTSQKNTIKYFQYMHKEFSSLRGRKKIYFHVKKCEKCEEHLLPDDVFLCEDGHQCHRPCVLSSGKNQCFYKLCEKKIVNMNEIEKEILDSFSKGIC